jgi:soluble lytic murein transglycosylase
MAQEELQKIWPDVKKLWLTGSSLPNACDDVLQYFLKNKKISQQLIWQR